MLTVSPSGLPPSLPLPSVPPLSGLRLALHQGVLRAALGNTRDAAILRLRRISTYTLRRNIDTTRGTETPLDNLYC